MRYSAKDITTAGLFGALGVVLPMLFHLAGLGSTFLPMHLPILICGLLVSAPVALVVGIVTPLISSAITGMPPFLPVGVIMLVELGILGLSASLLRRYMRLPVILAVVGAMLAARVAGALEVLAIAPVIGVEQNPALYLGVAFVASWPGILIQLIVAPMVVRVAESIKAKGVSS